MSRLTLDTTGIKSPLDIGADTSAATTPTRTTLAPAKTRGEGKTTPRRAARTRRKSPTPAPATAPSTPVPTPFYGEGRPIQTSIAIDASLASELDDLARAAAVPFNALVVATLHAGLPTTAEQALHAAIHERADRPRASRIEYNVRLPTQLRARLDELSANVRDTAKRARRADLTNAALRSALPAEAAQAAELVQEHRRRLELLALAV